MNSTRFVILAAALILGATLVAVSAASAETWTNVSVVTDDGWEYEGVIVESDSGQSHVTLVNADGGHKRMTHSSIRVIRDRFGADITAIVLSGKEHAPAEISRPDPARGSMHPEHSDREDSSPVAVFPPPRSPGTRGPNLGLALLGPRFRFSSSFAVGASAVTGDWFDGLTSGPSGDVTVRIAPGANWSIGLNYRYQKLEVKPGLRAPMPIDDGSGGQIIALPDWDVDLREMFFLMGTMTKPRTYAIPVLYFDVGVGAIQHNLGLTLTLPDGRSVSGGTRETKFAMLLDAGAIIPLGRSLGLDLGGSARVTGQGMDTTSNHTSASSTGLLYGGHLGLAFMFGG